MIQIDMDMPKNCYDCQFRSCKGWDEFYCDVTLEDVDITSEERSRDCPLKEQGLKLEKIAAILKTAKADPTRDEYAEYYLDAIEEVVRWTQI